MWGCHTSASSIYYTIYLSPAPHLLYLQFSGGRNVCVALSLKVNANDVFLLFSQFFSSPFHTETRKRKFFSISLAYCWGAIVLSMLFTYGLLAEAKRSFCLCSCVCGRVYLIKRCAIVELEMLCLPTVRPNSILLRLNEMAQHSSGIYGQRVVELDGSLWCFVYAVCARVTPAQQHLIPNKTPSNTFGVTSGYSRNIFFDVQETLMERKSHSSNSGPHEHRPITYLAFSRNINFQMCVGWCRWREQISNACSSPATDGPAQNSKVLYFRDRNVTESFPIKITQSGEWWQHHRGSH